MEFIYNAPTKVFFGNINYEDLGVEIKRYGTKVLVLTGGQVTQAIANSVIGNLESDFEIKIFSGIKTNASIDFIKEIAVLANKPDVIVTIGGGSVHDSGKALSIALTHEGELEEYTIDGNISVQGIKSTVIPIITIPTIYGTGAEVSPAALLKIENKKRVIFSPNLYPKATFVDCSFAQDIPTKLCINTAIDALVQGIESLVSSSAQSFSERFSISAIERTMKSMLSIAKGDTNIQVIENLAIASIESLYAVGQSSVGAVHAISDPLSGRYDIHHGLAVGILLPFVVDVNYLYAQEKYDYVKCIIEKVMNRKFDTLSNALLAYYDEINFEKNALQNKIDLLTFQNDIELLIAESYNGDLVGNPCELTDALIRSILNNAYRVS